MSIILCGKDRIDISQVSDVTIKTISNYVLSEFEEQYHGDCPGSLASLEHELYRLKRNRYSHTSSSNIKFGEKLEKTLNKYWYEVGLALPRPQSNNRSRDNWTYAPKKRSYFSVGYINEEGEASVIWEFQKDYGTNAADHHIFGDAKTTLSLTADIMPVMRQLAQKKPATKTKTQKTGEFLSFLWD